MAKILYPRFASSANIVFQLVVYYFTALLAVLVDHLHLRYYFAVVHCIVGPPPVHIKILLNTVRGQKVMVGLNVDFICAISFIQGRISGPDQGLYLMS